MPRFLASASATAILASSLTGTALLVAPPAQAVNYAAKCAVHRLSVPGGTVQSEVGAGDAAGDWLAGTITTAAGVRAVTWHNSIRSDLDVPVETPRITGVNSHGDVVGQATGGAHLQSFAVVNGKYVELTAPGAGADQVAATGISDAGIVSGYLLYGHRPDDAVKWDVSAPDSPVILAVPHGFGGVARSVNARGQIALNAIRGEQHSRAYVLGTKGKRHPLKPAETQTDAAVGPIALGWAAGYEHDPKTGGGSVVRWNLRDHRSVQAIDTPMSAELAINSTGEIGGQLGDQRAAVINGTTTTPLPGLPGAPRGAVQTLADNGTAAGSVLDPDGMTTAVTWTC